MSNIGLGPKSINNNNPVKQGDSPQADSSKLSTVIVPSTDDIQESQKLDEVVVKLNKVIEFGCKQAIKDQEEEAQFLEMLKAFHARDDQNSAKSVTLENYLLRLTTTFFPWLRERCTIFL